nr:MAG TPA: portal protein [Caudoviricetes sp.]
MADRITSGLRRLMGAAPQKTGPRNAVTVAALQAAGLSGAYADTSAGAAMKLSAVDRCVEVLSSDIAKLPMYVFDRNTRLIRQDHPLASLLGLRANGVQTSFEAMKLMEASRLCGGNGYMLVERDPRSLRPVRLVAVPWQNVSPQLGSDGSVYYDVTHPFTGAQLRRVRRTDMVHVRAYSRNGWLGISVLERASEVIASARAAQTWNGSYYVNGGQPSGVLETDTDIGGYTEEPQDDGTTRKVSIKDTIREEWEKRHTGPGNANRVAVLDMGLKYKPISVSQKDAQFVENAELSIRDIARFFGVPLYKLQEGKQSYNSNEQNAIEYVTGTLHPIVTAYEQAFTSILLTPREIAEGLEIRMNMMAELRGDSTARGNWYRTMHDIGAYSVNDVLALEDMPDTEGGDEHVASLNYVPLALWRELSVRRNSENSQGNGGDSA